MAEGSATVHFVGGFKVSNRASNQTVTEFDVHSRSGQVRGLFRDCMLLGPRLVSRVVAM